MKSIRSLSFAAVLAGACCFFGNGCQSQAGSPPPVSAAGKLVPVSDNDTAWLTKAKADYPLTTCVVCGDPLNHAGTPLAYIYRAPGRPDRLVMLCDDDCLPGFSKSPEKYLKMIDDASAANKKPVPATP